jgi:hypothetical protein
MVATGGMFSYFGVGHGMVRVRLQEEETWWMKRSLGKCFRPVGGRKAGFPVKAEPNRRSHDGREKVLGGAKGCGSASPEDSERSQSPLPMSIP